MTNARRNLARRIEAGQAYDSKRKRDELSELHTATKSAAVIRIFGQVQEPAALLPPCSTGNSTAVLVASNTPSSREHLDSPTYNNGSTQQRDYHAQRDVELAIAQQTVTLPPPRNYGIATCDSPLSETRITANKTQSVAVTFTPRAFPTPLRASRKCQEAAWLTARTLAETQSHNRAPAILPWALDRAELLLSNGDTQSAAAVLTECLGPDAAGGWDCRRGNDSSGAVRRALALRAAIRFQMGEYRSSSLDAEAALRAVSQPPADTHHSVGAVIVSESTVLGILGAAAVVHAAMANQMCISEARHAAKQLLWATPFPSDSWIELRNVVDKALTALERKFAADALAQGGHYEASLLAYRAVVTDYPACAGAFANMAILALLLEDAKHVLSIGVDFPQTCGCVDAVVAIHTAADSAVRLTSSAAVWRVASACRGGALLMPASFCSSQTGDEGGCDQHGNGNASFIATAACAALLMAPLVPTRDCALWARTQSTALLHRATAVVRLRRCIGGEASAALLHLESEVTLLAAIRSDAAEAVALDATGSGAAAAALLQQLDS